jgi:signal peptidase II
MRRLVYVLLAGILVVADRLIKAWAARTLILGESRPLWGNLFHLTRMHNIGGAFGIFPGSGYLFLAVSALVSVVLFVLLVLGKARGWFLRTGLALVLAGAIGNLIDRLQFGYVLDFFDVRGFSIFNLADSCVTVGVAVILVHALLLGGERDRASRGTDRL